MIRRKAALVPAGAMRVSQRDGVGRAVSAFESETAAVIVRTSPKHDQIILEILAAILVLSIFLMTVVHLDRVVTANGQIIPTEGMLFVQPLEKSIVHDIHVNMGDIVKKGQVLATLDPTFTDADVADLKEKLSSGEAHFARLQAEYQQKPYDPAGTSAYETLQFSIWQQRQSEYKGALADFDARMKAAETSVGRLRQDVETYKTRLKLASQLEHMYSQLESQGYGNKEKLLATTDARAEADRLLSASQSSIAETEHSLDALKAQRAVYMDQWRTTLSNELVTARGELQQTQESLKKADKLSQLGSLVAPTDAVVLKIGKLSVGSVAAGGEQGTEPLFTLVPLAGPLEAEVEVDSSDMGFIRVGDPVEIKLNAYRFLQHGTAKGVIKTISDGSFTANDSSPSEARSPFFKVRIAFTEVHLRDVPANFRLVPGMTLAADIMIGRRTIMSYLIEGALRTGREAMREP
jgi:hemolysin D